MDRLLLEKEQSHCPLLALTSDHSSWSRALVILFVKQQSINFFSNELAFQQFNKLSWLNKRVLWLVQNSSFENQWDTMADIINHPAPSKANRDARPVLVATTALGVATHCSKPSPPSLAMALWGIFSTTPKYLYLPVPAVTQPAMKQNSLVPHFVFPTVLKILNSLWFVLPE